MTRPLLRAALGAGLPLLLAACVNVIPQPETPEALYRIGPMEPAHRLSASVVVREPEASRLFSGRAIAAEDATGALRIIRGIQWSDSATHMMQTALLDSLGGEGQGVAVGSSSGAPARFELVWRISDFTLSGTTALCRLEATLLDGRRRTVISQTNVATSAIALDNTNAARAKALTDAGRACVSDVAAFVASSTEDSGAE
ncbi:ABC-type transport auxiliary lipoprotein family protein [Hyphomonas sp.]|uniref:ABC-type transport auxiliary lipoprotein family protein n=1 Tax=Hyphomonas sp. TaxID=87 RepID=UPI00391B156A